MTEERVLVGAAICVVVLIVSAIIEFWPKNKDPQ